MDYQKIQKIIENLTQLLKQLQQLQLELLPEHLKNANNETFLKACDKKNIRDVELMLKMHNIDPSFDDNKGIKNAASLFNDEKSNELVKILLKDPRITPPNYLLAWECGKILPDMELFKMLFNHKKIDPSDNNNEAMKVACKMGREEIVEILLQDSRVNPTVGIRNAVYYGNMKLFELLYNDKRTDPSEGKNSPIRIACMTRRIEFIEILLKDSRVDPSDCDNEALIYAIKNDNNEIALQLLQHPKVKAKLGW